MNYKETGFRGLYDQFSVYSLNENIKALINGLEGFDDANGVLTYGYYDDNEGLLLEVLAPAKINDGKVTFEVASTDERRTIKLEDVLAENFDHVDDKDGFLKKRYADKFSVLKAFAPSAKHEATRRLAFLDECRDEIFFDEIRVIFNREGKQPEECSVRIEEQVEGHFVGSLVSDPVQDFGFVAGDRIIFYVAKDEDGALVCAADLTPSIFLTEDDLEDGSMLENAVHTFITGKKEADLVELLQILRDSYVWMPCRMLSELNVETDLEEGMSPDLFQKGADYFLPIFSSEKEMKEFADGRSKYPVRVTKAISMAKESSKPITAIVLNAFTEPFVIDMKLCDVIEKLKSRVEE